MAGYLSDYLKTLPSIQQDVLKEILNRNETTASYREEIKELVAYISEHNDVHFKARTQKERSSSEDYNDNLKEIQYDLHALFRLSAIIDQYSQRNLAMSESVIKEIEQRIRKMEKQVKRYQMTRKTNEHFHHVILEDFSSPQRTEEKESALKELRRDRQGRRVRKDKTAEVIYNKLQLPSAFAHNQMTTNYGRPLGTIQVRNRLGMETHKQKHPVEHAIDGSSNTFWSELILTDEPIIQNNPQRWSYEYHDYPTEGAVCELEIDFFHTATISEFLFEPYGHHPIEIISVTGYEREEFDGRHYDIISPNHEDRGRRSASSTETMTFQFPSIDVRKVRILLRQENYTRENFLLDVEEKRNRDFWEKISRDRKEISDFKDPNETMASFNLANDLGGWTQYLNALSKWAEAEGNETLIAQAKKAMEIVRLGDFKNPLLLYLQSENAEPGVPNEDLSQAFQAVDKIAYLYGARQIRFEGREFRRQGIYISKELDIPASTKEITLRTEEFHPQVDLLREATDYKQHQTITDIEYYITNQEAPLPSEWRSILPVQKKYVEAEHLHIDDSMRKDQQFQEMIESGDDLLVFSLRFQAISNDSVVLKRNGFEVPRDHFIVSDDSRKIAIKATSYSPASTYTVDYIPDPSAYIYNIDDHEEPSLYMDDNGEIGEFFEESNYDNRVVLKHAPHVHRKAYIDQSDQLYPVQVFVNGEPFQNITDYSTNQYKEEDLLQNSGKTFAQIGKEIIFGRPAGQEIRNIHVDYYHTNNRVRLKAILKRNQLNFQTITPAVYEYEIRCSHKEMGATDQ